jgi:hypothetical protein
MREIYVYGFISGNGKKEFEGYSVYSPVYRNMGFMVSTKDDKELESIVSEQLKEHPHSMLISGIPDVTYYTGDKFAIDYGNNNTTVYMPSDSKDISRFLTKVDFSKMKRFEVTDGQRYFIFRAMSEEELPKSVRDKLYVQRTSSS